MAMWQRTRFEMKQELVRLAGVEGACKRALFARFSISPTTGYKWLKRYGAAQDGGLAERSRRPHAMPRRTGEALEGAVLAVRAAHPAWGGRKIAAVLRRDGLAPPAASTITQILRRHGVAVGSEASGPAARGRFEHEAPNDLWQMDFKGHVGLGAGGRCHPLTVLDDHSRFNLVTAACADERRAGVQARLAEVFERYGKPRRIICDNGAPWGAASGDADAAGFTGLAIWLLEHDIALSHSRPYHPQTCGKDERYHRTLKAEAMRQTFADLVEAQHAFDRFRAVYNCERPHQALGMAVPADRYTISPRRYTPTVAPFDYGPDATLRRVDKNGFVSVKARKLRISKAFRDKTIALRPTPDDGVFELAFRTLTINKLDLRTPRT
jgi:transposase InsO family protein